MTEELFPSPADAVVPDTVVPEPAKPATASGRKWLIAALVVAVVGLVAMTGFAAYLWSVHSQYVAQNEQLRDEATSLGKQLATSKDIAARAREQQKVTYAQLTEAKATISGLANSEAQAGDDRQALIDVADGLQQCADARQDLIDHLNEAYKWTSASLHAFEANTTTYCNKVSKSYDEVVSD